jgi:hypothetical protein
MPSRFKLSTFLLVFLSGAFFGAVGISISAGVGGSARFPDVPAGSYFDLPVGEMYDLGVIRGHADGKFRPADTVSRADVAVMFSRFRKSLLGEDIVSSSSSSTSSASSSTSSSASTPAPRNPAGSIRFTIGAFRVAEDAGTAKVTIIRTGGAEGVVSVNFALEDGTAKAGEDYRSNTAKLTFANGETNRIFVVEILNDEDEEGEETFNVVLSDPRDGVELGTPTTATITILDDETTEDDGGSGGGTGPAAGTFEFGALAYSMAEDAGNVTITVKRTGGSEGSVAVHYATVEGTARKVSDYADSSGTLTFSSGETSRPFTVSLNDDIATEGNEKFSVRLTLPTGGAEIADQSTVEVTIADDEVVSFGTGSLRLSDSQYDVQESAGNAVITVERTGGARGQISVDYKSRGGGAKSGQDFEAVNATLIFEDGETKKTFLVPIIDDTGNDPDETFHVDILNPTHGATLGSTDTAVVTIRQ